MRIRILCVLAAALPCLFLGCEKKAAKPAAADTNAAAGGNPLTAPVDYLGAVAKGKQRAEKTIETAAIDRAIDQFKIDQGRNPKSLDELVQEGFLTKIPEAPYGMKIVYDPASGTVKIVKE